MKEESPARWAVVGTTGQYQFTAPPSQRAASEKAEGRREGITEAVRHAIRRRAFYDTALRPGFALDPRDAA